MNQAAFCESPGVVQFGYADRANHTLGNDPILNQISVLTVAFAHD